MRRSPAAASRSACLGAGLAAVLAACGGGGGGGGGPVPGYLTADVRGAGGLGAALAVEQGGVAAPESDAAAAAGDVAREVEQSDVARIDGSRLVLLNPHRGLVVVDLVSVAVTGQVPLAGWPRELHLRGDRALAFHGDFAGGSTLSVVALSGPGAPAVETSFDLGGGYVASRVVGDVLYAVTDGEVRSFSLGAAVTPVDAVDLPAGASVAYATPSLLLVGGTWDWGSDATPFSLVDVSDPAGALALRGGFDVDGFVTDDTRLHVQGAVACVISHSWADTGLSHLATFSLADPDAPLALGALDLARGEQLFATRFDGDTAYLVTFEQVDPLWVVDLRVPTAPAVVGSLVVPGWSAQLVPASGGRLVAVGVDPTDGWRVTASLFDVSDPAAPALLDREDLGEGWTEAFHDARALRVDDAQGHATLPLSGGAADGVVVLDLGPAALDVRGTIPLAGTALRGLGHGAELVAISTEEVAVADASSLAVRGRATVAQNVVEAMRLSDGRLLSLVLTGTSGRLGALDLPFAPTALHPRGDRAVVLGWDDQGPCAYVADFAPPAPTLSGRFAVGSSWWFQPVGLASPIAWGGFAPEARMTPSGRLVVRGLPGAAPGDPGDGKVDFPGAIDFAGGAGAGGAPASSPGSDGFVVIDVDAAALEAPVVFAGGVVTGYALDGETLWASLSAGSATDGQGRPLLRHDLARVDLATRARVVAADAPGHVVAAHGGLVFTADEQWDEGWSWSCEVVASSMGGAGGLVELDRLALPAGAYDLRAAGATLCFTTAPTWVFDGGVGALPPGMAPGGTGRDVVALGGAAVSDPFAPGPADFGHVGTVRLAASLAFGPSVDVDGFLAVLLPEDGAVLVVRDGTRLERHDLSGAAATLDWSVDVSGWPWAARADTTPGSYLVALGYGGVRVVP